MSTDLMLMDGNTQLPAHLAGRDFGVTKNLQQGIYLGGNRIGLKSSRFRLIVAGKEEGVFEENYLDVIILGASDAVGRIYYSGAYRQGDNQPPACYSADGITSAEDAKTRQSIKCDTCPQNIKGSKIVDGNKYKACGYFRRLIVMLPGDDRVYKLDVKAQGLFGESSNDKKRMALNDYIKFVGNRGIDLGTVITRLSFDIDASVPKLMFAASRWVTPDELNAVENLVGSDEVAQLKVISMATVDLSGEEEVPEEGAQGNAQGAATEQQAAASSAPVDEPAQAQVTQRPVQTTQRPAPVQQQPVRQQPVQQSVVVEDNVQRPTQQRPVQTAQRPVQQQSVQQTAQESIVRSTPAVQQIMSDTELDAMLEGLD